MVCNLFYTDVFVSVPGAAPVARYKDLNLKGVVHSPLLFSEV